MAFVLLVGTCVCVYVCVYVYVGMHVWTYVWTPEVNFRTLSFSFLMLRPLADLELISLARQTGQ